MGKASRKLKKAVEKNTERQQEKKQQAEETAELFDKGKKFMDMGRVADGIATFETLLAKHPKLSTEQNENLRDMLRYFAEKSMKRLKEGYPNVTRFAENLLADERGEKAQAAAEKKESKRRLDNLKAKLNKSS